MSDKVMDIEGMLQREEGAWTELAGVLASVPSERRDVEGVVPGWSVHDLAWHCVYWADYAAASLEMRNSGTDGDPAEMPEPEIVAKGRSMSWDEVLEQGSAARARVRAAISATGEITDSISELISSETYDHYDEHSVEIRAFIA
jgi:hypothetical protein